MNSIMNVILLSIMMMANAGSAIASEYSHLILEKKYTEAEQAIAAKLATTPDNPEALAARVDFILAKNQANRLDEAEKSAEKCVASNPGSSLCYEALGNTLGAKSLSGSMFGKISNAGKIRDAFVKAVELDSSNFRARISLLRYYLKAPSIVGGGKSKAQALAIETATLNKDIGKLMTALVELNDEKIVEAGIALSGADLGAFELLHPIWRDTIFTIANGLLGQRKFIEAGKLFSDLKKRFPNNELGYFGLGRIAQEQGKYGDSIPLLETASNLSARAFIFYRLGNSYFAINEKPKAKSAFEKALSVAPGLISSQKSDAEEKISQLKQKL